MKAPTMRAVLRNWRQALKEQGLHRAPPLDLWEGHMAYRNLLRCKSLNVAMLKKSADGNFKGLGDWKTKRILEQLGRAVRTYADFLGNVQTSKKELTNEQKFLTDLLQWLSNADDRSSKYPDLNRALRECARSCEQELRLLEKQRAATWRPLVGFWGALLSQPMFRDPIRDMDLDAWFQITVAVIFRFFLRGVSLRTISRFVVLFYICCGFTQYRKKERTDKHFSELVNRYNNEPITVDAVDQKLRAAKIQRLHLQFEGQVGKPWPAEIANEEFD